MSPAPPTCFMKRAALNIVVNDIMINLVRSRALLPSLRLEAYFSSGTAYIPIRPLKEHRNILYTRGTEIRYSYLPKVINCAPLAALLIEGFVNGWSGLVIAGSVLTFLLALKTNGAISLFRAMQIRELAVNKNLSKFELVIPRNVASLNFEESLLKSRRSTFQQQFKRQIRSGTIIASAEVLQKWKTASDEELNRQALVYRFKRPEISIQLNRNQISSFSLLSIKEVRKKAAWMTVGGKGGREEDKDKGILEDYRTEKQKGDTLVIETQEVEGLKMMFYARIPLNQDKKHEQYIQALVDNKNIVII